MIKLGTKLGWALAEAALASGDRKAFAAHCTIGRVRHEAGLRSLRAALEQEGEFEAGVMRCECFQLMISELSSAGPIYTEIASFELRNRVHRSENGKN